MKSHLERVRELNEASLDYPSVLPLIGAVMELEAKFQHLEQSKQDKLPHSPMESVNPKELTRGSLQAKLYKLLSTAGDKEHEVALKVHSFLSSLE